MKIILFGMTCVGKTELGKIVANKLNLKFFDIFDEKKKECGTIENFNFTYSFPHERNMRQKEMIEKIVKENESFLLATGPLNYKSAFNKFLKMDDVVCILLKDTAENIFKRLIYTDEFDVLCNDNDEYKAMYKKQILRELKKDDTYYRKVYKDIPNIFDVSGDDICVASQRLYELICEIKKSEEYISSIEIR